MTVQDQGLGTYPRGIGTVINRWDRLLLVGRVVAVVFRFSHTDLLAAPQKCPSARHWSQQAHSLERRTDSVQNTVFKQTHHSICMPD